MKTTSLTRKIIAGALAVSAAFSASAISGSARTIIMTGDCDGDYVFTSNDALTALRRSLSDEELSRAMLWRTDADHDGQITSNDAELILRQSVGFDAVSKGYGEEEHVFDVNDGMNNFSAELFKRTYSSDPDTNTLVSPLSAYIALSMAANGTENGTKDDMLKMLSGGGDLGKEDINTYINGYMSQVNNGGFMKIANSMFVMQRDDVTIYPKFIDVLKSEYFAEIFNEPAGDEAVDHINEWCNKNTDGMIPQLLPHGALGPDTVSVLLNAVAFDAKWADPYEKSDIRDREFTNADGTVSRVDFLNSTESVYLSDDKAEGVMKYYDTWEEGGSQHERYAFIGILPKEGVTVEEYVASMTGSTISDLVETKGYGYEVHTHIPKFTYSRTYNLNAPLYDMGIGSAFDPYNADFSEMGKSESGNIHIDTVVQKTFIRLDENGTKAAAVTGIIMTDAAAVEENYKEIDLNRPFIYCIYDVKNNVPVFIGTINSLK